jgi:hypothetical protein
MWQTDMEYDLSNYKNKKIDTLSEKKEEWTKF